VKDEQQERPADKSHIVIYEKRNARDAAQSHDPQPLCQFILEGALRNLPQCQPKNDGQYEPN